MSETDEAARDCRRLLEVVAELHRRGFQRLRISPGMSPSGLHWRCLIAPAALFSPDHGARVTREIDEEVARYSSGARDNYFDWDDAAGADVGGLADRFVERFPSIAAAGLGSDPDYAAWYEYMLRQTSPDNLPIVYADWPLPEDQISTVGPLSVTVSLPPPGASIA